MIICKEPDKRVEDRVTRSRVQLLLNEPFFGTLTMALTPTQSEDVPSMATDGKRLFYNPKWVDSLNDREITAAELHETLHCALEHFTRAGNRNKKVWNIAIDFAANAIIQKSGYELPKGALLDRDFADMCAEEIYDKIMDDAIDITGMMTLDEHPDTIYVDSDEEGDGDDECESEGDGEGEGEGEGSGLTQDNKDGKGGQGKDKEQKGDTSQSKDEPVKWEPGMNDWKVILAQAAQATKTRGKMPAGFERLIEDILNPTIDWKTMLSEFVMNISKNDYNMMRPNRRHLHNGIYFPSLRSEDVELAVAIDTSGSIGDDELKVFISELMGIMQSIRGYRIHLISCDAAVHGYKIIEFPDSAVPKDAIAGGGGTDFRPVFDKIKDEDIQVRCLVYLTDGYGTFPTEEPELPTLWVITNKEIEPPFGRVARLID